MTDRFPVQPGLDSMATVEAAMVTFLGVAREAAAAGAFELDADSATVFTAAQCQDEQHYYALLAAGGVPRTNAFTIPEEAVSDRTMMLVTMLELKAIGIAGYMALSRTWARLGNLDQVETTYQMGVVEAQHLALSHALVGVTPANDRAFARWLYVDAAEAGPSLTALGLIEGSGNSVSFPGPIDRLCRGIFGLTPVTTSQMTRPRPATE
jgi:hypothetical protein